MSVKQAARRSFIGPLKRSIDDWRLQRLVQALRRTPTSYEEVLEGIRHAWGNEAFSADISYISELAFRIEKCESPILECGSGITTVIAGILAEKRNLRVWSLEQDTEWAQFVSQRLKRNGIHNVDLRYVPLQKCDDYVWYRVDEVDMPHHFGLVLCDGPAVFDDWGEACAQWRYGVIPSLNGKGISFSEILLDDATEPRAANLLRRWQVEFGLEHQLLRTLHGDLAVVKHGEHLELRLQAEKILLGT